MTMEWILELTQKLLHKVHHLSIDTSHSMTYITGLWSLVVYKDNTSFNYYFI